MSETKHTPGPWYLSETTSVYPGGNSVLLNVESRDGTIARIDKRDGPVPSQSVINAKLIAAAPELLETLQDLAKTLRPSIMGLGVRKGFSEMAALAQADAAIAKATA